MSCHDITIIPGGGDDVGTHHGCASIQSAKKCRTSIGKQDPYNRCTWRMASGGSCCTLVHNVPLSS